MVSAACQKRGIPVFASASWGMLYGACYLALFSLISNHEFTIEPTAKYVLGLVWLAIVLLDIKITLLALAIAFTLAWSVDRQASLRGLIPAWYMRMRHILTAGATVSLLATAFAPAIG